AEDVAEGVPDALEDIGGGPRLGGGSGGRGGGGGVLLVDGPVEDVAGQGDLPAGVERAPVDRRSGVPEPADRGQQGGLVGGLLDGVAQDVDEDLVGASPRLVGGEGREAAAGAQFDAVEGT